MAGEDRLVAGIRVGRPKVSHADPTHVPGVRSGNTFGNSKQAPGHLPDGRSTARRSTAINPEDRDAILPEMPNLSPA